MTIKDKIKKRQETTTGHNTYKKTNKNKKQVINNMQTNNTQKQTWDTHSKANIIKQWTNTKTYKKAGQTNKNKIHKQRTHIIRQEQETHRHTNKYKETK